MAHKQAIHKSATKTLRRGSPLVLLIGTLFALLAGSSPVAVPALTQWQKNQQINSLEYKKQYGYWEVLDLPNEFKSNTIHAAALPTGKILLVAGSGNNRQNFNEFHDEGYIKVLKTVVLNPDNLEVKLVDTPSDFFCSGHALLHSGSLLIAGGTSGYEVLDEDVKKPAGPMLLHNEDPDGHKKVFPKGTKFKSPSGKEYISTQTVELEPASKIDHENGNVHIHHSSAKVFVEAASEDPSYATNANEQYSIEGLTGSDTHNIYGQGGPMTLKKQDYRGDNHSYEFDPISEKYVETGSLNESRWYPTMPVLANGDVLAVSGLDNTGVITETTERYNPKDKKWSWGPNLAIPTYPALFRTLNPNVLFFSGSNAGYGPEDKGRTPGFWNIESNTFTPVNGLREPGVVETSGSVMLPPKKGSNDGSQSFRIMLAGGGGIGESELSTARTDIIDISSPEPNYTPGPDLPAPLRYLNLTVLPTDEVFANGGSTNYRAKDNSYSIRSFMIDPTSGQLKQMADELVNRSYHSGSLLLKDGRVLVFGNDPLFEDKANTTPGKFEQRIEIFTPPEYFRGERPKLEGDEVIQAKRGEQIKIKTTDAGSIQAARLIPPSSATHVTNIEQRSVGVVATANSGEVNLSIPADENILPDGWYMLFITSKDGIPSKAKMVEVKG